MTKLLQNIVPFVLMIESNNNSFQPLPHKEYKILLTELCYEEIFIVPRVAEI